MTLVSWHCCWWREHKITSNFIKGAPYGCHFGNKPKRKGRSCEGTHENNSDFHVGDVSWLDSAIVAVIDNNGYSSSLYLVGHGGESFKDLGDDCGKGFYFGLEFH